LVAEFLGNALLAAKEEVGRATELLSANYVEHDVRAGDALHSGVTLAATDPNSRHAIGHGVGGAGEGTDEGGIALGFHNSMDADEADIAFTLVAQILIYPGKGFLPVEGFDANAE
jgi:hypothetical protein